MDAVDDIASFISKMVNSIDEICTRYDNVISRLQSTDEVDDEERWLLKDATKNVIDELEKQTIPSTKNMLLMIGTLNARVRILMEKCERAFPQLDELGRLKSLLTEIEAVLAKTPSTKLPNCPFCHHSPGSRLVRSQNGEDPNLFMYVAEKMATPNLHQDQNGRNGDDDIIQSPMNREPVNTTSIQNHEHRRRRRNHSDPRRRRKFSSGKRQRSFSEPPCMKGEMNGAKIQSTPSQPDEKPIDFIAPIEKETSVDAEAVKSKNFDQVQRAEKRKDGFSWFLVGLAVLMSFNAMIVLINVLINFINPKMFGPYLWQSYCKAANELCQFGFETFCSDYCASRLERYLWRKK